MFFLFFYLKILISKIFIIILKKPKKPTNLIYHIVIFHTEIIQFSILRGDLWLLLKYFNFDDSFPLQFQLLEVWIEKLKIGKINYIFWQHKKLCLKPIVWKKRKKSMDSPCFWFYTQLTFANYFFTTFYRVQTYSSI